MPCTHLLRLSGLATTFLLIAVSARGDDWIRFRGPNGTGISKDKTVPMTFDAKNNVRWKVPVGDGNASPIVFGNRLFLHSTSKDGTSRALTCFDTADGKELWKKSIKGKKVGVRPDSSLASSTPTTDGKLVYVSFWDGNDVILTAFDFNGEQQWSRNLGVFFSQHGPGASPIVYKDKIILANDMDAYREIKDKKKVVTKLPVANPSVLWALDKQTGRTVWEQKREAHRACYSAPYILEKKGESPELIITSTTAITSYNPDSGAPNWTWKWTFAAGPLRTVASTGYMNGVLVAFSGDGDGRRQMVGVAMNGFGKDARPDQLWENTKRKELPYVTCPLIVGDNVFYVSDEGTVACLHGKTGKYLWSERLTDAKFYASPLLIDGKIYAPSEQGDIFVIAANARKYEQLARNALGERIRATPAVADGRLYVRGQYHLFCIGKQ